MHLKKGLLVSLILILAYSNCYSSILDSSIVPVVGKKIKDSELHITYPNKKTKKISDYRGKWLLLDFWNEYCSSCISLMPETDNFRKKYKDKIEVILVGIRGKNPETIETLYQKIRANKNVSIPAAFTNDLDKTFNVTGLPTIFLIDPDGYLRTRQIYISENEFEEFLAGKNPTPGILQKENKQQPKYDSHLPFMVRNNGAVDTGFTYRSLFANWNDSIIRDAVFLKNGKIEAIGVQVRDLFKIAYLGMAMWTTEDTMLYGKYSTNIALQIKDSTLFRQFPEKIARVCYSLCYPMRNVPTTNTANGYILTDTQVKKMIQSDLSNYYPYSVTIEPRKEKCYVLVSSNHNASKLKTQGAKPSVTTPNGPRQGTLLTNQPARRIISVLWGASESPRTTFYDETNIKHNIDIFIDGVYYKDMVSTLEKNGLKVIETERYINTLVIKDRIP